MKNLCILCKSVVNYHESLSSSHSHYNTQDLNIFIKYFKTDKTGTGKDNNDDEDLISALQFCPTCVCFLNNLVQLNDQLDSINYEINRLITQVSAVVIKSEKYDCSNETNCCQDGFNSSSDVNTTNIKREVAEEEQQGESLSFINFRRGIFQRFCPRVLLTDCKNDASYNTFNLVTSDNYYWNNSPLSEPEHVDFESDINEEESNQSALKSNKKNKNGRKNGKSKNEQKKQKKEGRRSKKSTSAKSKQKKVKKEKNEEEEAHLKIERPVQISDNLFCLAGQWKFEKTEEGYRCCECGTKSRQPNNIGQRLIVRHINMKHNTNWHSCSVCKKAWRDPKKRDTHNCCPKVYKTTPVIKVGLGKFLYNGTLPFENLTPEEKAAHPEYEFKCLTCGILTRTRASINAHLRERHADTTSWVCDTCGKVFVNIRRLKEHKKIHQERNLICDKCGKSFKNNVLLNCHRKFHLDPSIRHPCEVCGQTFRYKHGLRKHRQKQGHNAHKIMISPKFRFTPKPQSSQQETISDAQRNFNNEIPRKNYIPVQNNNIPFETSNICKEEGNELRIL